MSGQLPGDYKKKELSGIESSLAALKQIDFELAYLALLTREGVKPLSRWEKPLEDKEMELLGAIGLQTKRIARTVRAGRGVSESIFSRSPAYIDLYTKRFENKPIEKSVETQRFEGFLFGYPPCCIEQYILKPYAANNLAEKDQKILFHWACSGCKITPFLLDSYRKTAGLIENL
ncbi:MAG: hypothetical protein JW787_16755 [Sedimentisphaerales bacterium]|nr:hypothetical protein [Sedimentisphaerales bacterium]